MSILIKKPGILSTVQDLGRPGSRRFGINPNGVMDSAAARLINLALGNDQNAAVLEMHFPAAEIEFLDDTCFAVGGGDFDARLDGIEAPNWRTAFANKGNVLKFARKKFGNRAYLSVSGGFRVNEWLGSASTNLVAKAGGLDGHKLETGDRIDCESFLNRPPISIGLSLVPRYSRFPTVHVVAGAEYGLLTAISERKFLNDSFTVTSDSNRMGYRLKGEPLHLLHKKEMISSAVDFGTIQLLPDGQMILLMADHQTSGGYPQMAHVIKRDLPLAAQLTPNDTLSFHVISTEQAEAITSEFEHELAFFKTGLKFTNA